MRDRDAPSRTEELYRWLVELPEGAPLPCMAEIGRILRFPKSAASSYVCAALVSFRNAHRIEYAHGTRSALRGHCIVRLPSGRVHMTEGCLLRLPAASADQCANSCPSPVRTDADHA